MRVGIDCLDINPNDVGGQLTYLFGLLSGLNKVKDENTSIVLICSSKNQKDFERIAKQYSFSTISISCYSKYVRALFYFFPILINSKKLWRISGNLYSDIFRVNKTIQKHCDVLYVVTTVLNVYNLKTPTVLSMHDIQHVHFPEFFSKMRLRVRNLRFENSAKAATIIQASSNFIKNDLLENFTFLNPINIKVINEGVDLNEFSLSETCDVNIKYSLPEKYLFFPATFWKHKNHLLVLKALNNIYEKHNIKIPLILTGSKQTAYDEIMKYIDDKNMDYVKYLGKVSWKELIAIYKNAYMLITAVLYESSSLPILEAAASGLPVIASKTPPNIEMSNHLILNLFDPYNVNELELLLLNCWNNPKIINQKISNLQKLKRFSWVNLALEYLSEFEKLCKIKSFNNNI